MKCRLNNVVKDIKTNEYLVTFATLDVTALEDVNAEKDLDVTVKEYRKKRSLDSNAYCWVLCTKLANKLQSTKEEVYEEMLRRTGFIDKDKIIAIPEDNSIDDYDGHWLYILSEDGWSTYVKIRGSSTYDTKEMSIFLDNIIEECRAQGVEVLPAEEIERMINLWNQ